MINVYDKDELLKLQAEKYEEDIAHYESGLEWARLEGKEEGSKESKINIAKNMLNEKMNVSFISKLTGLSIEEINKLK